jgi:glutamyl-tRNA synthetase
MKETQLCKTRFAPSPTGRLHLGNARTALFNWLYAHNQKGSFLLRIEDTDLSRSKEEYIQALVEDLHWLGLVWEEGEGIGGPYAPYRQSLRTAIYENYLQQLGDRAYPCFCTSEMLELDRRLARAQGKPPRYSGRCAHLSKAEVEDKIAQGLPYTLRFRVPEGQTVVFTDLVRGEQRYLTDEIGDFIIRRTDQTFPFFFVNAVDDALMQVSHVLRGEDHLSNTPRQILILQALSLPIPTYAHIPLILDESGAPLSKRKGDLSLSALRAQGFLPLALVNYLARLGHAYAESDILPLEGLADRFDLSRVGRAPARFDEQQMLFWQKLAVRALGHEDFKRWLLESIALPESLPLHFFTLMQQEITLPDEALSWVRRFEADLPPYEEEARTLLLQTPPSFFAACLEAFQESGISFVQELPQKTGRSGKTLFLPLRAALTGTLHGPDFKSLLTLLDAEKIKKRLLYAKESLCLSSTTA